MCSNRYSILEKAFGLRDPLPPTIASLDAETTIPSAEKDNDGHLLPIKDEPNNLSHTSDGVDFDPSCLSDSVNPVWQPPASPPSMNNSNSNSNSPSSTSNSNSNSNSNGNSNGNGNGNENSMNSNNTSNLNSNVNGSNNSNSIQPTHAAGDSLGVSTAGSPICPKLSHVADLASESVEPSSTTAKVENPNTSVLALIIEHVDILDMLMLNCPDFPTLFALVASCKTAKHAFEIHPQGIIKALLQTMPQELRYLTGALIGINGCNIGNSYSVRKNMEIWLGKGKKPLSKRLQTRPFEIVKKLARSFSAIDLFMKVIPKNCENNLADYQMVLASRVGLDYADVTRSSSKHPLLQQTEWSDVPDDTEWDVPWLPAGVGPQAISLPLNDRETYRLKRALLRYEIFCAIFYLGPDEYYDKDRGYRSDLAPKFCRRRAFCNAQKVFLEKYVNPWEIGELAVVSHFMYDLVRNAYFYQYLTLRLRDAVDSWYGPFRNKNYGQNRHFDHEEVADEFDNHTVWFASQGLTLLKKIYVDRNLGYDALVEKHCQPRYRAAELFLPFQKCADRQWYDVSDPKDSWTPRHTWSDTLGMELPSKSWLAKGPTSDSTGYDHAYWGEKWMRKIGYYFWDRD